MNPVVGRRRRGAYGQVPLRRRADPRVIRWFRRSQTTQSTCTLRTRGQHCFRTTCLLCSSNSSAPSCSAALGAVKQVTHLQATPQRGQDSDDLGLGVERSERRPTQGQCLLPTHMNSYIRCLSSRPLVEWDALPRKGALDRPRECTPYAQSRRVKS